MKRTNQIAPKAGEAEALLQILAMSHKDVEAGRLLPVQEAFAAIRARLKGLTGAETPSRA